MSAELERIEQIIDASGVADIELLLPTGVRPRQLRLTTLLIGMTLAMRAGRQAFLTDLHTTLTALPIEDQRRLGVIARWPHGEHQLTYRHVEYTFDRVIATLAKDTPDGTPSERLHDVLDRLLEASVQVLGEPSSSSYAVDWTDQETWSLPPPRKPSAPATTAAANRVGDTAPADHDAGDSANDTTHQPPPTPGCADPEASWGHRRGDAPGQDDELFFGYYLQAARIVNDELGPRGPRARPPHAPELLRSRPATRVRARPGTDARHRRHDLRRARRLRLQLPRTSEMGAPHPPTRDRPDPRSSPQRPRPARHPPRRDQPQRQPLLPRHPHHPARARTTAPWRQPRADRHPRPAVRRAGPLQALPDHQPRPRRLPPCDLPRRSRQTPLPLQACVADAPQRPPHDPQPARAPTPLLHPENDHRAAISERQDNKKHDYPSAAHRTSYNRRTAAKRTFATLTDRATNDLCFASDFATEVLLFFNLILGGLRGPEPGGRDVMMDNGKRKTRRQLSPEEKWEIFLEVTSQEISQADASRKYGVDVSVIIRLRALAKDAALAAFASAKPGPAGVGGGCRGGSCCARRTIGSARR